MLLVYSGSLDLGRGGFCTKRIVVKTVRPKERNGKKVDKAGKLFAVKKGTAKITVSSGGKQKVITVNVK
jgi:uncharacterized protein YjdB